MKSFAIGCSLGLAILTTSVALAQPPASPPVRNMGSGAPKLNPPPANLMPTAVGGAVVYVHNLEAQRQWYETMLGFRVRTVYARDNVPFEYIMGIGDSPAFMGLMVSSARPQGSNTNSRVVLPVPDPKGLAEHMSRQGVYVREAVPGSAYFILDPEGNQVELYRLSTPAPAAK